LLVALELFAPLAVATLLAVAVAPLPPDPDIPE